MQQQVSAVSGIVVFLLFGILSWILPVNYPYIPVYDVKSVQLMYQETSLEFETASTLERPVLHNEIIILDILKGSSFKHIFLSTGTGVDKSYFSYPNGLDKLNSLQPNVIFRSGFAHDQILLKKYKLTLSTPTKYNIEIVEQHDDSRTHKVTFITREEYKSLQDSLLDFKDNESDKLSFVRGKEVRLDFFIRIRLKGKIRKNVADDINLFRGWFLSSPDDCQSVPEEALSSCSFKAQINKEPWNEFDFNYLASKHLKICSDTFFRTTESGSSTLSWDSQKTTELHFVGDSQPFYECQQLQEFLSSFNSSSPAPLLFKSRKEYVSVSCNKMRGAPTYEPKKYSKTFTATLQQTFDDSVRGSRKILLLNLSGLWEAAYGGLKGYSFEQIIESLLKIVIEQKKVYGIDEIFYLTTTIVSPRLYENLYNDSSKFAMTQTRVEYVNKMTKQVINDLFRDEIRILETGALSWVGEGDPAEPGDMRHLGPRTNLKILKFILCNVFEDSLT